MRLTALHSRTPVSCLAIASSIVLAAGLFSSSRAQEAENYTISGNDGYGIAECMKTGSECGRVIADSWCESHGHAHALGYEMGEDVTGALPASTVPVVKVAAGDVVIRCGD